MASLTIDFAAGANAGSGQDWTTPGNIVASDNARASVPLSAINFQSKDILCDEMDASALPDDATIVGLEVIIEGTDSGLGAAAYNKVQFHRGGTGVGDNKAATPVAMPNSETDTTFGGSADLWGLTLTPSDFKDATNGILVAVIHQSSNPQADIDYVRLKVYYTLPSNCQSPKNVSSVDDGDVTPPSPIAWTDPHEAAVEDSVGAICSMTSFDPGSEKLKATGFDFSAIPHGATINGIEVHVRCRDAGGGTRATITYIKLEHNGASVGNDKGDLAVMPASYADITYGGDSDLWGTSLTTAQIRDGTMGVGIQVGVNSPPGNVDADVDHIEMCVHYTAPEEEETPLDDNALWPWRWHRHWRSRRHRRGGLGMAPN